MSDDFQDREIQCAETPEHTFTWTAKDQAFYAERGFTPPKRCKQHAAERRAFFNEHPEKAKGGGRRRTESTGDDFGGSF